MKKLSSAKEYKKLYMTKHWRVLREQILARDLWRCQRKNCGQFLQRGRSHPRSAVIHHIVPHKGDIDLFYDMNNLQAVCWTCHSGKIQSEEARGYSKEIGIDGWPVDPRHPCAR